jgi:hypothetical protein
MSPYMHDDSAALCCSAFYSEYGESNSSRTANPTVSSGGGKREQASVPKSSAAGDLRSFDSSAQI